MQLLSNIILEVLVSAVMQGKEVNSMQIEKEDTKLVLFTDCMIIYVKNPKNLTKKLLELINNYSNLARYKVNIQKLIAFLYTNSEQVEFEIQCH